MAKLKADYINWVLTLNATQAQEEFHKLEKANKELQKETTANRKALAQLTAEGKKGTAEWNNLKKSIDDNSKAMAQNRAKMDEVMKRMDLSTMSVSQLRKRLKELKREFDSTSKATDPKHYKDLRNEITRLQAAIDKANASARGLQGGFFSLTKMKQTLIGFFNGVGLTIMSLVTGSFRNAFNLIVDFEKANSKLAGILGSTKDGIKDMTAAARQLGATTSYTAAEVTSLQIELAKLGFGKEQIIQMEGAVLKFAKAVGTDLASASKFAGASMRIFDIDASEVNDMLATLALGTSKSALDFQYLSSAMSTAGPIAKMYGFSIQDTTALLGELANAGFDASTAGTAIRNLFLNLADSGGELAQALGKPVHTLDDLVDGLKKLQKDGVDVQRALELTDKRLVSPFAKLMAEADDIKTLRDEVTGVTEDFNKMSETMADNVAGAMAGLQSAAQELVLKIASGTSGPIKDLIKMLTSLVGIIGTVYEWMTRFSGVIKTVVAVLVGYKLGITAAQLATKLYYATIRAGSAVMAAARAAMILFSSGFKALKGNIVAATRSFTAFKAALASTPWTAVIGAIAAITAAVVAWCSGNDKVTESIEKVNEAEEKMKQQAKDHAAKREEFINKLNTEKTKLLELHKVAENENASKERRLKAIQEINKICPAYNGHLDTERGKLKANTKALNEYIVSMEKRMRLAYYKDEYQQYINEQEAAKSRQRKAAKQWEAHRNDMVEDDRTYTAPAHLGPIRLPWRTTQGEKKMVRRWRATSDDYKTEYEQANRGVEATTRNLENFKTEMQANGINIEDVFTFANEAVDGFTEKTEDAGAATTVVVDKVKELKKELKALRKQEAKDDAEYAEIEAEKKKIQDQLKNLSGKGNKNRQKHEAGTYGEDSLDEATASADDLHQKKLLEINKSRLKGDISETEMVIKKNEELIRYCGDLMVALEKLRKETKSTHTATIDKINAEERKIEQQLVTAQININKATADKEAEAHNQRLEANKAFYETQEQEMRRSVNEGKVTEEAADIYLLARKKEFHEQQLQELNDFYNKSKDADYLADEERTKLLDKTQGEIRSMTSQVLTDTGSLMEKIRELSTDTTSAEGIRSMYDAQRVSIEQTYAAAVKNVDLSDKQIVALEEEKQRRIAELNYQQQEQQWQLQELTGLTWGQEYERELAQLENYHKQGLIKEKDYQSKKLQLGVTNAKRYFDYYSGLSGSMFQAIQDAEIAMSDAKFDVLIQQAKNNGEDTAELEQQKENEKLEIQKKYADVNFAIKISQIIADTAVAIMQAFSQLGPIGGGIAAALITATGVAQVIQAKAERDKVKNMQPGNTSGSGSVKAAPKAERTLTGYSEGGYTGDGDRYEVAGVVHRGEYVVPKPIMENPRVIDAVGTIEAIRRNKMAGSGIPATTPAGSYAEGGFTTPAAMPEFTELVTATQELREAARNIRAYVVLRDIDDARESLDRARAPFTRKP